MHALIDHRLVRPPSSSGSLSWSGLAGPVAGAAVPVLALLAAVGLIGVGLWLDDRRVDLGLGALAGALAACGAFGLYLRRRLIRPLGELKEAIVRAEHSDWRKLGETGDDPVGQVIAAFNRMIDGLDAGQRELRDAMHHAEQAARAKDAFLAHVSHELRTPLNAIIGFSQVMRDEMFGPLASSRYHGYAVDIHESGAHLLGVINQILDLSKIEAGKFELFEEPVVMGEALEACVRLIQPQARLGEIEILCEIEPDLPRLLGDEVRIKQIAFNLLSNAVKFTPRGGKVWVVARLAHHGGLVLTVADNGIGMAPEDIPNALAPFRQVEGEIWKTREGTGTGLGLPLVKAFAELHGASFAIDSERGLGTSVTIGFPARRLLSAGG